MFGSMRHIQKSKHTKSSKKPCRRRLRPWGSSAAGCRFPALLWWNPGPLRCPPRPGWTPSRRAESALGCWGCWHRNHCAPPAETHAQRWGGWRALFCSTSRLKPLNIQIRISHDKRKKGIMSRAAETKDWWHFIAIFVKVHPLTNEVISVISFVLTFIHVPSHGLEMELVCLTETH